MNANPKKPRPVPVTGHVAERMVRAPRFVCSANSSAILPVAIGNRAFIRAGASRWPEIPARSAR